MASIGLDSNAERIRFADETNDTLRITNILREESARQDAGNILRIAQLFEGLPYRAGTLEGEQELLTINIDEFDCTTFVETVLAFAYTASERRRSWHDFAYNLEKMRYRGGKMDGYASRLHYSSEWIVDNISRGNIQEITSDLPGSRYNIKSLDFMSRNATLYPALSDSANLAGIKHAESGLSNHRYAVLKAPQVKDKVLEKYVKSGDIILFTTSKPGLDVTHMGIIAMIQNKPRIIHASSKEKKIVTDKLTIEEYVKRNKVEGIRIIRLTPD